MFSFDLLSRQNHEIAELTKVLAHLVKERELCDTKVASDLLEQYITHIQEHFRRNNQYIYSDLLTARDLAVNNTAKRFLEGEKEIKKLFNEFVERWCERGLHIDDHQRFLNEAADIFRLMSERIRAESEELYPLARKLTRSMGFPQHA